jgi:hypothetical protein
MPSHELPLKLHATFLVTFLLMFVITFVVAIGAILDYPPFDRISANYTWQLFTILVAEIAVIGVGVFRSILNPQSLTILRYRVKVAYLNYSVQLEQALSDEQKKTWARYNTKPSGMRLSRMDQALIAELKSAKLNDGQWSEGQAYLNCDAGRRWLEGSFIYQFPGDQYLTHVPVVGEVLENGNMKLDLSQPERIFWDEDEPRVRAAANYSVELQRDPKDRRMLTCVLHYPPQKINADIEVAGITFYEIN